MERTTWRASIGGVSGRSKTREEGEETAKLPDEGAGAQNEEKEDD